MFMRVGGGIFTKAADVGADLVGKVEAGIPEDDPRNAATIADNVGDNVGDCAGMAADLFESYAVTLVASLILGSVAFGTKGLLFPLIVPAIGVITAIIGVFITRARAGESGLTTINRSFYISAGISAVLCAVAAFTYLPSKFNKFQGVSADIAGNGGNPALIAFIAVIIGIVLAAVILWLTGVYTGTEGKAVQDVGKSSLTGAATVILSGISVGFESAVYTALVISAAVFGAFLLGGRLRSADHRRRDRRDGHLRSGLGQRPGHRGDVRRRERRGRADPHRTRRGRQHDQGDHQGHRDRDGRAGRDRVVRLVPGRHHSGHRQGR
jgi:K(+)-stimulated pyrophosphate-energized sodium pump